MSHCSNVKRCLPPRAVAGLICTNCQPHQVVTDAIYDARSICLREYGDAPEVDVYGDPGFAFAYVPSHLHHMVSDCRARPRFDRKLRLLDLGCLPAHALQGKERTGLRTLWPVPSRGDMQQTIKAGK